MLKLADISVLEGLQNQAHERMGLQPKMTSMSVFNSPTTLKDKLSALIPKVEQGVAEGGFAQEMAMNLVLKALGDEMSQMLVLDKISSTSDLEQLINKNVLNPFLKQVNLPKEVEQTLREDAYQLYKQTSPAKELPDYIPTNPNDPRCPGPIIGIEGGEWKVRTAVEKAQESEDWRVAREVHKQGDAYKGKPLTERQKQYLGTVRDVEKVFPSN